MAVDISGSMGIGQVAGVYGLTPRMAASAMAMAIVHREPNYYIAGFSTREERSSNRSGTNVMTPLDITATDNLHDAMAKTQAPSLWRDGLLPAHAGRPGEEVAGGLLHNSY